MTEYREITKLLFQYTWVFFQLAENRVSDSLKFTETLFWYTEFSKQKLYFPNVINIPGFPSSMGHSFFPLGLPMLADNRVCWMSLFVYWVFFQNRNYGFENIYSTLFSPDFPPIRSVNARMVAYNREFTKFLFCYTEFSKQKLWFPKITIAPGFPSIIRHSTFRQLNLPMRECWRIIEGSLRFLFGIFNRKTIVST